MEKHQIKLKIEFSYGKYNAPVENSDLLYHYCSMDAFVNIVKSGKIRMGDLKSMNDPSELSLQNFNFGEIIYKQYLKDPFEFKVETEKQVIDMQTFLLPTLVNFNFGQCGRYSNLLFALCFSDKNDDLTQWRLYGDQGNGVCLGFKKSEIENFKKIDKNFTVKKIDYFSDIELKLIKIAKKILKKIKTLYQNEQYKDLEAYRYDLSSDLIEEWPAYKPDDYLLENETRLIYRLNNHRFFSNTTNIPKEDLTDIDVKIKDGELLLFKEIDLKTLGLSTITLGPLNKTTKDCMNVFLAKNNIDIRADKIYKSIKPYRK